MFVHIVPQKGILWLGWTGFNGGSAFAANENCGLAIATTYASAAAAMVAQLNMRYGLNSLKGVIRGVMYGSIRGVIKGDTRSLDHSV